ncbi:MAG: hypothetical protein JJT76_15635 [Clostridiaceae bacterium]|nr:hypothetical protein [Clostridiaceae bacterium]
MNKFYSRNVMPKVISIFFALTIWVYVMSEINPRITRDEQNIPVNFINIEEIREMGLVLKGSEEYTIRVRMTGRRDEVHGVTRGQIKATADLLGYRTGINNIPVEVSVPGEVDVDYSPKFIRVELEEIVSRQKPVNVTIEGTPRRGFLLGDVQYEPTVVWVEGAESLVNAVERVEATVRLSEEFQNISTQLTLRPVNSRGEEVKDVTLQTTRVNIQLPVDQLKTVEVVPVVQATTPEGYEINSINANPNTVTIRGQGEILEGINYVNTEAVTIDNITEDRNVTVDLDLPEGVSIVEADNINIRISIERIIEETYAISREDIIFKNLGDGLVVDKSNIPETVEVKILATESTMQTINRGDLEVVVDMESLEANDYTIEPVVNLPFLIERRIRGLQLIPSSINVRVIDPNNEEQV